MIALPPVAGADQFTVTCPSPRVPATPVGAPGTVAGVTAAEGDEADPGPTAFDAVTRNVYPVPFANPVTTRQVSAAGEHAAVVAAEYDPPLACSTA